MDDFCGAISGLHPVVQPVKKEGRVRTSSESWPGKNDKNSVEEVLRLHPQGYILKNKGPFGKPFLTDPFGMFGDDDSWKP